MCKFTRTRQRLPQNTPAPPGESGAASRLSAGARSRSLLATGRIWSIPSFYRLLRLIPVGRCCGSPAIDPREKTGPEYYIINRQFTR